MRQQFALPRQPCPFVAHRDLASRIHVRNAVLQKSKVAGPRIFRENMNREEIADSYRLNRVAEAAGEFSARR
jgi:hypothetical protein